MADTKISALAAVASVADAQEFAVNDAGTSKKATAQQIGRLLVARIAGASGAAGGYLTVQRLTANSADVTTTALSAAIMTTTGLGAGTWKYYLTGYESGDVFGSEVFRSDAGAPDPFRVERGGEELSVVPRLTLRVSGPGEDGRAVGP